MKRLIAMTAVLVMLTSLTACASKSRRNLTLETNVQPASAADTTEATETTEAKTEAKTESGTLEFNEDLDEDLVGTWKYAYDDDLDAYYVISEDHTMMSMIDLSSLMFIKNGKLVLGEDDPSCTFSFRENDDHLVAKVEKRVILDIKPHKGADSDEVQGDFDLYESIVLPEEEAPTEATTSDSEEDEDEDEKLRRILRFEGKKTYLIELGGCYSSDDQLIFLTNQKRLVMDYKFSGSDKDTLVVKDEEGNEIKLTRSELDEDENDD